MNLRRAYLLKETTHLLHGIVQVAHVKGLCSRVQQNIVSPPIPHAFPQLEPRSWFFCGKALWNQTSECAKQTVKYVRWNGGKNMSKYNEHKGVKHG